jgi:hypothetical protein
LEIDGCNAQEYNVYLNNRTLTVESQPKFSKYALTRGSSAGDVTKAESIVIRKDDGIIYDLKGHKLESPPASGIYIKNGKKYYCY